MVSNQYDNIPPELKTYHNWVCGDLNKAPINPKTGGFAMANVSSTWGTFEEAVGYLNAHSKNGIRTIGFEVCKTEGNRDPFTCIDLDHCRNVDTGKIEPWADEIIKISDSYTEVSPSGNGIRIITTCDLPSVNRKRGGLGADGKGAIEIASSGKYFSITGNHLAGTPSHIGYRPDEIKAIFEQYFALKPEQPKETPKPLQSISDEELLKKALNAENASKFRSLWEGNINGYPSHSEADQALCCHLAFWTGNDAARIDSLFQQSGLMREKWLRDDYRTATISRAIEMTKEVYSAQSEKKQML